MVNEERDLCISISEDKNVSIFSLKDQTLGTVHTTWWLRLLPVYLDSLLIKVQTIPSRTFPKRFGLKPISAALFNNYSQVLIVGSMNLCLFVPDLERELALRYIALSRAFEYKDSFHLSNTVELDLVAT